MTPTTRLTELDGLRGLAALSVFLSHSILTLPESSLTSALRIPPLHLVWDGAAAVDLFFVLSGFVLALPFVGGREKSMDYATFIIRRAFRILPAYWLSLLLALALRHVVYEPNTSTVFSDWTTDFWLTPTTFWLDHIMLAGRWTITSLINPVIRPDINTFDINPVIWTLVVEIRMSLVFPLVILLIRRVGSTLHCALLMLLSVFIAILVPILWALPLFTLGGLVAHFRQQLSERVSTFAIVPRVSLWLLALMFYNARFVSLDVRPIGQLAHYLSGFGAALLILLILSCGARFLQTRPVQFLGSTSYGLYLFHLPILITIASLMPASTHSPLLVWAIACTLTLIITFVVSAVSYWRLEVPAQAYGRATARRLRPGPTTRLRQHPADPGHHPST